MASTGVTAEIWRRVRRPDGLWFFDVGFDAGGNLHNPNGYDPELVRSAVDAARVRWKARLGASAKKAAVTRRRRQENKVYQAARRIIDGGTFGPSSHCSICGKGLDDRESIARGIGSECWQRVLELLNQRANVGGYDNDLGRQ
jgi:Family of unknown function (DUF6011)